MEVLKSDFSEYLTYHVRSLNIIIEKALKAELKDTPINCDEYYVLISNWSKQPLSLHELSAHSNLTLRKTELALTALCAVGLVRRELNADLHAMAVYALTQNGEARHSHLLSKRRSALEQAFNATPKEDVQTALSVLMTLENSISGAE